MFRFRTQNLHVRRARVAAVFVAGTAPARAQCPNGNHVWMAYNMGGPLGYVDRLTNLFNSAAAAIPPSAGTEGIDLNRSLTTAYVALFNQGWLLAINLTTGQGTVINSFLSGPRGVELNAAETDAWVTEETAGRLVSVNLTTGVSTTVATGLNAPRGFAVDSTETYAHVAESSSVTAGIRPPDAEGARHGTVTIAVVVDLRGTGKLLGSYGATLDWDASRLQYLSDTGGGPAFDAAVVNRDGTASGRLAFADAYAPGAGGLVNVFNVTFLVSADPLATAAIDLEFTSLYAAATYEDLLPGLTAQDGIVWSTHFDLGLAPADVGGTLFAWNAIPGAAGYDLVRGDLGMIYDDGSTVHLGGVVCVEDDSADTTTAAGTEPASPDTAVPATGAAFFYLVRFHDGASNRTYGFSYQAGRPRQPGSGDCP